MDSPKRVYLQVFRLSGTTPFPIEMLTADHCFPDSPWDADAIRQSYRPDHGRIQVCLRRVVGTPVWIDQAAWRALGWNLIEDSLHQLDITKWEKNGDDFTQSCLGGYIGWP